MTIATQNDQQMASSKRWPLFSFNNIWMLLLWIVLSFIWGSYKFKSDKNSSLIALGLEASQVASSLEAHLARFQSLPKILAKTPDIKRVLYLPNEVVTERTNRLLKQLNEQLSTDVIYILQTDGTTVASSNYDNPESFIGKNYDFRPYYKSALLGNEGRYHALGTASRKLGYYYSAPIYSSDRIIGVIVIKINLKFIDRLTSYPDLDYMIVDENGIIFFSTKRDWMYQAISSLSEEKVLKINKSRQYGKLNPGVILKDIKSVDSDEFFCIGSGKYCNKYLHAEEYIQESKWDVYTLSPQRLLLTDLFYSLVLSSSLFWLIALSVLFYRNYKSHERYLADEKSRLLNTVGILTADLRKTNNELQANVDHYRSAKLELEHTQDELIQAEKLALLGELSVGLNHELNQPILAIKAYSENGIRFLQRHQIDSAERNLSEISKISDTMGEIIAQFKVFSRKENTLSLVNMADIVEGSLVIMQPRLSFQKVVLNKHWEDNIDAIFYCNSTQMQQVVVNLIANAAQALDKTPHPKIDISIFIHADLVVLEVADNGPGIDSQNKENIFTPFFTTKPQGLGVGLSLSKRIVELFKGKIYAKNNIHGGTVFRLEFSAYSGQLK